MKSPVSCCDGGGVDVGSGENMRASLPLSQLFMVKKVRRECGQVWWRVEHREDNKRGSTT